MCRGNRVMALALDNTFDHVIVVFQCRYISRTGIETEVNVTVGLCLGLALATSLPRGSVLFLLGLHRFCHVLVNSVHDPNPRGCVVVRQRFDQNFDTVSELHGNKLDVQDRSSYS